MQPHDLAIRNATVVTASERFAADIAIADGRIAALGPALTARREIDATGLLALPGGVDPHCHIEQRSGLGLMMADDWASATRAAALGGTTTVIPFVAQAKGASLADAAADYHARAETGAIIDYAMHLIVADPRPEVLEGELPALVESGHASLKVFTTYPGVRLDDAGLLAVLGAARRLGALVAVHAENDAIVAAATRALLAQGRTEPLAHAAARPRLAEIEAVSRVIALSEHTGQPVMIFHVSTAEAARSIGDARARGVKIWAETCPHYLLLTEADLDRPSPEGAKWICSPPLRRAGDQSALWRALAGGDLQAVSSDHAPFAYGPEGKLVAGPAPGFHEVPSGLPGLQWRVALIFDAVVSRGGGDPRDVVRWTAAEPARLYGLDARKGSIAIGMDADIALWDPGREVAITDALSADATGYTPYAGRRITGWPVTVLSRGRVVVADGRVEAGPGSGRFLARRAGAPAMPGPLR